MLNSLKSDVYVFSGLKTHAQLLEASRMLLTEDGIVKSFAKFSQDVAALKKDYNQDYLEAEYQFAVTSAQMAGKWAQVNDDYDLQYRTAFDDRVRESHKALHDITLPANDPFWVSYYPPNGWRCRCNAVQVRKGKYDLTDSSAAIASGEKATTQLGKDGKNKLEIFRYNPGLQQVIFPPHHPYNKVAGASKVKAVVKKKLTDTSHLDEFIYSNFFQSKSEIQSSIYFSDAQKINKKIRPAEAFCVRKYTGSFYSEVNRYLRGDRNPPSDYYENFTSVANSGLDKFKSFKGEVYRGAYLTDDLFKTYSDGYNNKTPFIEKGFFSTTSTPGKSFEGNTVYKIKSKNGKSVRAISNFQSEDEILFKAGTEFKVVNAIEQKNGEKSIYIIELEEN